MLNLSSILTFTGPALPDFYVQYELERVLKEVWPTKSDTERYWRVVRKALQQPLTETSGAMRVRNVVIAPLMVAMGYGELTTAQTVRTREGDEQGGFLSTAPNGSSLRSWAWGYNIDLDAPIEIGLTSRYTPQRIAERVLLATGERVGWLTNGLELRLIISEAARAASRVEVSLTSLKTYPASEPADAFSLLLALGSPAGVAKLPDILEDARLKQGKVTKDLRAQARAAVEGFVQGLLDYPDNQPILEAYLYRNGHHAGVGSHETETSGNANLETRNMELANLLWREALIVVYRLLFILSGEAGTRERPPFSFASTSLWRHTYSPSVALGQVAQQVVDEGVQTGHYLEHGLRTLFRLFERGIRSTELTIAPLGGMLFGKQAAALVDRLHWGEFSCALLLDKLLRAPRGRGLVRLSYRDLDVEELGRVYETLLELEPGLAIADMVRLRRHKLEVVVPAVQGEKYRPLGIIDEFDDDSDEDEEEQSQVANRKTKIEWIEAIPGPGDRYPLGRFYLRVGLGRKSAGAYYTPASFVRFLVQETLGPLCDEHSPTDDPQPQAILGLRVLDPAMGSAHFLVGACRFLGQRLYEACRRCAEQGLWERIPEEVTSYLPGRAPEGRSEAGLSAEKARSMCKRLIAVNCLYGVDKNPLAVELAKLALWLESFAEELPLTFLDHRLVCGDSLLGPLNIVGDGPNSPMTPPYAITPLDYAIGQRFRTRLREHLRLALAQVDHLNATVGLNEQDIAKKQRLKGELDTILYPFAELCRAWSGGIMLGPGQVDEGGYIKALELLVADAWPLDNNDETDLNDERLTSGFREMLTKGRQANVLIYPLTFPEVFYPTGEVTELTGFDAVIGNPPWDRVRPFAKEFYASFDFEIIAAPTKRERQKIEKRLESQPKIKQAFETYKASFDEQGRVHDTLFEWQSVQIGDIWAGRGNADSYVLFAEQTIKLSKENGLVGIVLPSGFHGNEGSTGIRQMYLWHAQLQKCFSFENRRKLFDIHSSFKFATVIAKKNQEGTDKFDAAFYLHDDEWLFGDKSSPPMLSYSRQFVEKNSPSYLNFLELKFPKDLEIALTCLEDSTPLDKVCGSLSITTGVQADMTRDAWRYDSTEEVLSNGRDPRDPEVTRSLVKGRYLLLHEGKTFHHYTDQWDEIPSYIVSLEKLTDRIGWLKEAKFYRLAYRGVASSTNERTVIYTLLPPAVVAGNSAPIERKPHLRPNSNALWLLAVVNSFCFDWTIRVRVGANINQFILYAGPIPDVSNIKPFLAHSALRLVCNHPGYAPLWAEQLGSEWREPTLPQTWPILAEEEARWKARAAIDAIIAQTYGLNREQYVHILRSFDRASGPNPHTARCLAKWDELHHLGLEAFTRQYDPYWDVPLVELLPKPVIELPAVTKVDDSPQLRFDLSLEPTPSAQKKEPMILPIPTPSIPVEKEIEWKPAYRQAVVETWLVDQFALPQKSLSQFKATKYMYFLERAQLTKLEIPFRAFAAGPYDPGLRYKVGHLADKQHFLSIKGKNLVRGRNAKKAILAAEKVITNLDHARQLLAQITELSDEKLGGWATVDFVCRKLNETGQPLTPENIRAYFFSDWPEKLLDPWYTDENIQEATRHLKEIGVL